MSAILFCICSIVFDTFCFCLYATLKWKVLDIYFSLCNVYKVCSTKGLSLLLCFLYLQSYWRFLSLFFNFILWIWLAGFDMSGLLLANHWSFLRFLLSHAFLVISVICNPPTGEALFGTDIGTFWRSYQYCLELACL